MPGPVSLQKLIETTPFFLIIQALAIAIVTWYWFWYRSNSKRHRHQDRQLTAEVFYVHNKLNIM